MEEEREAAIKSAGNEVEGLSESIRHTAIPAATEHHGRQQFKSRDCAPRDRRALE